MREMIKNSLYVKDASACWNTLTPGSKFRARNKLGDVHEYEFIGRDVFYSPHGEDYWVIRASSHVPPMIVETEWFRQRYITILSEWHKEYVSIEAEDSQWGEDLICCTVPHDVDGEDIVWAMRHALEELEEDTSLVDEDDSAEEITDKIIERAMERVNGTFRFVEITPFKYEYDWGKWNEDHEEDEHEEF